MDVFLMTLLMLLGMFMMLVVLLQRGRGGGLAGAFGGAGGQSAFGTKAGDVFTKITVVVAVLWFILAGVSGMVLRGKESKFAGGENAQPEETGDSEGAGTDENAPPTQKAGASDFDPIPSTPEKSGDPEGSSDGKAADKAEAGDDAGKGVTPEPPTSPEDNKAAAPSNDKAGEAADDKAGAPSDDKAGTAGKAGESTTEKAGTDGKSAGDGN